MTTILPTCGRVLSVLSIIVLLLTVSSLPWMLGGVIPLARLVLLCGAIIAAVLSILANLLRRQLPTAVPAVMIPLTGLALLGMFQLRPADHSPVLDMRHAVHAPVLAEPVNEPAHSLSPADTRSTVGTLLALALIACVAYDQIRSPVAMLIGSLVLMANGLVMTTVGMSSLFQNRDFFLNDRWTWGDKRYFGDVFATFVNPNNAAGWLCLILAVAAGWITWHLKPASTAPSLRRGRLRVSIWGRLWQGMVEFMADLTVWQILAFTGLAVLGAGVAATRSRGGILAMLLAAVLTACIKSSVRHLPAVLLMLSICVAATFGTLFWLDLDVGVVAEMETLQDMESAAGSRPQHWWDSLHVLLDFPLLGTGLGSYRFSTLPYQTVFAGVWFQNADNHFVDLAIEGGLAGLMLFSLVGICGLLTGLAAWKQSKTRTLNRQSDTPRVSRRILAGLGTATVFATLSQSVSGLLDYGIGMPAASSTLVLIIAATAGFLTQANAKPGLRSTGAFKLVRSVILPLQVALAIGATCLVEDQFAASEIDDSVVAGRQILNPPVDAAQLDQLNPTRTQLERLLVERPDDPEALRLLPQLADAEFRWNFLQTATDGKIVADAGLSTLWTQFTNRVLMDRLQLLERNDSTTAAALRQQLASLLDDSQVSAALTKTQKWLPLMPKIAFEQATLAALTDNVPSFRKQAEVCRFGEPVSAGNLFVLGSLSLRMHDPALAQKFWQESLALTDQFRAAILTDARLQWSGEESLEMFGPNDYVSCVRAAQATTDRDQKQELFARSEMLWADVIPPVSSDMSLARVTHLLATDRSIEAIQWLEQSLKVHSDDLPMRIRYARLLEQDGQFRKALEEWGRVQYHQPRNAEADTAITRIRRMKSAPKK